MFSLLDLEFGVSEGGTGSGLRGLGCGVCCVASNLKPQP